MEYLVSTLVWILGTFGMSTIIVNSQIMLPVRNFLSFSKMVKDDQGVITDLVERKFKFFGKLVNCILCMGFWSGCFWGGLYWNPFGAAEAHWILELLFAGCFGSATTWIVYLLIYPMMQGK
jgi:hypothetical protein